MFYFLMHSSLSVLLHLISVYIYTYIIFIICIIYTYILYILSILYISLSLSLSPWHSFIVKNVNNNNIIVIILCLIIIIITLQLCFLNHLHILIVFVYSLFIIIVMWWVHVEVRESAHVSTLSISMIPSRDFEPLFKAEMCV